MIRLNLGCENIKKEGWINIDINPKVEPDIVADVTDLSNHFKPNSVDEIYAGHLLEHLYPQEAITAVENWKSLLKEGGKLCVVVPDFKYLVKAYMGGSMSIEELAMEYVYSYVQPSHHRWIYDIESLIRFLEEAGFKDIKTIDRLQDERLAYPVNWQVGVEAVK